VKCRKLPITKAARVCLRLNPAKSTKERPATDRIIVYGAIGYTGTLVARALLARGMTPVLAYGADLVMGFEGSSLIDG